MPKIHQKVSLRIPRGSWAGIYSTYVEGIDKEALTVAHPMHGGAIIPLHSGEELRVEFIDGGERLAFETRVLRRFTQVVPIVALELPSPGSIHRHQQRDFVRLDANLSFTYAIIPAKPPEDGKPVEKIYLPGRTTDISGSGAQILTAEAYPVGTKLELILRLQGDEIRITAEVVRLAQHPTPREVWLGVRFTQVDWRDRERIVRFIFSEQRQRRQKGLL